MTRTIVGLGISIALASGACKSEPQGPGLPVSVYTRNLYLGTDLTPLALVQNAADVPAAAAMMWSNVQASDFPSRAKVIAAEIAALSPDLVALQEVTLYRRQVPGDYQPGDSVPNATEVVLDFLATLNGELAALGADYQVANEAFNADAELPVADGAGGTFDLRVTDRDVILARAGVTTANPLAAVFSNGFALTVGGTGGVPLRFARGVSRVDATVGDAHFTFANSHLEIQALEAVQIAQAGEVLDLLSTAAEPIVLAGDYNSPPGAPSYVLLTTTGSFKDLYDAVADGATPTCCQSDDLTNPVSAANERIDLILGRGRVRAKSARVTGTDPATDRTPSGLWPSDHFGVVADLEIVP